MYHIANGKVVDAIMGGSNFTVQGLGLGAKEKNNVELNLEVTDKRDLADLKQWFEDLWKNEELVADVKDEVLQYLSQPIRIIRQSSFTTRRSIISLSRNSNRNKARMR